MTDTRRGVVLRLPRRSPRRATAACPSICRRARRRARRTRARGSSASGGSCSCTTVCVRRRSTSWTARRCSSRRTSRYHMRVRRTPNQGRHVCVWPSVSSMVSVREEELSCGLLNSAIQKQGFGYAKQPVFMRSRVRVRRGLVYDRGQGSFGLHRRLSNGSVAKSHSR